MNSKIPYIILIIDRIIYYAFAFWVLYMIFHPESLGEWLRLVGEGINK